MCLITFIGHHHYRMLDMWTAPKTANQGQSQPRGELVP